MVKCCRKSEKNFYFLARKQTHSPSVSFATIEKLFCRSARSTSTALVSSMPEVINNPPSAKRGRITPESGIITSARMFAVMISKTASGVRDRKSVV